MKRHYWEFPIIIDLFLGGLGGGILFLAFLFDFFIMPGASEMFAMPMLVAFLSLGVSTFFLVFELGQPLVFWRVFATKTAIIKWGALLMTFSAICSMLWWASFLPFEWLGWLTALLSPLQPVLLGIGGVCGFGVMVYTGVMLSTLKARVFWATPGLPILFALSALLTACAAVTLSVGGWPAQLTYDSQIIASVAVPLVVTITYIASIVLAFAELVILLIVVLSAFGAGNKTAKEVAARWVKGKTAPVFWIGMVGVGLLIPLILLLAAPFSVASLIIAPVMLLIGGFLLRYLFVFSDERAEIPGENLYCGRMAKPNADFVSRWTYGENEF